MFCLYMNILFIYLPISELYQKLMFSHEYNVFHNDSRDIERLESFQMPADQERLFSLDVGFALLYIPL